MSLKEILRIESTELSAFFEKASISGAGTSQEIADRREGHFREFIARYYPYPFKVAKGNIEDASNSRSQSIDCVILSPAHPILVDQSGLQTVLLAEGVDAAIELKPDLADRSELERGLRQGLSVKKLHRNKVGILLDQATEHHNKIMFSLFCNRTFSDVRNLIEGIVQYYEKHNVPRLHQFDFVVVNNRLIVHNVCSVIPGFEVDQGIVFSEAGEDTMGAFLAFLESSPKSEMALGPSVLSYYLQPRQEGWMTYHDLNRRLANLS